MGKRKKEQVLHWAQCEECKRWRMLARAVGAYTSFVCSDRNRRCEEPEDTPSNNIHSSSSSSTTVIDEEDDYVRTLLLFFYFFFFLLNDL
jgi:hypothetical protein